MELLVNLSSPLDALQSLTDCARMVKQPIHRANPINSMILYSKNLSRKATTNVAYQHVLEVSLGILVETLTERGLTVSVPLLERLGQNLSSSNHRISLQFMSVSYQDLLANPELSFPEQNLLFLALYVAEVELVTYFEFSSYSLAEA